ncbi:uncharacterized protein LOC103722034 [Phoenix dactylifera]|uniref:Uncharacterized protein LOC103722034 n=1 Tax=Phoenix dactylifera TaxID=42345 RepID=A0A8B7D0K5_PHODC|nr:uncharacterized protein LOC103722034 [Phoenix dactylifera]
MAADVSSLARMPSGYNKEEGEGKRDLVTRDLLGGGAVLGSAGEVDLERQVPAGWERRLDLLSGKAYLQKRESNPSSRQVQDLNLPPPPASAAVGVGLSEDFTALDLKLAAVPPPPAAAAASSSASFDYLSVCTLEKVKSALERAERESRIRLPLRGQFDGSPSPSSSSTTSSSIKRRAAVDQDEDGATDVSNSSGGMIAAGCPGCLLYVLIAKVDPRCPRCDSHVPLPALKKKPKIDLNSAHTDWN